VQVGRRIKIEQRIRPDQVNVSDLLDERTLVFHRGNALQFRFEWSDPLGVSRLFVHARAVKIPNFLIDGIALRATLRCLLQDLPLDSKIAFVEFGKTLPEGRSAGFPNS
jgi:hypothetical protein